MNIVRHGILLLVLYILQGLVLPWFKSGAVPLLLCVAVAGVAHFEGSGNGGVFGMFAGILMDLSVGKPLLVFTVVYTVLGIVIGALGETLFTRRFVSYIFSNFVMLIITAFIQMFSLLFFMSAPVWHLIGSALLHTVLSLVCAVPLYPIIERISHRRHKKAERN